MNAQQYAELIEKHLLSCQYIEDKPRFPTHIEIFALDPETLFWKEKIDFQQNLRLTVMEQTVFDEGEMIERSFSYDLRERGDAGKLIWRIDNHNRKQPVTAPCHVHNLPHDPPDSRIECFVDSKKTDFPYAVHCIKNYFEGKSQEWEDPGQ